MMKSIAASTVTLSYALAIFYLSFVSAGTLGMFYKRVGITGGVSLLHLLSFFLMGVLLRFMFSTRLYEAWVHNPRAWSVYTAVILGRSTRVSAVVYAFPPCQGSGSAAACCRNILVLHH